MNEEQQNSFLPVLWKSNTQNTTEHQSIATNQKKGRFEEMKKTFVVITLVCMVACVTAYCGRTRGNNNNFNLLDGSGGNGYDDVNGNVQQDDQALAQAYRSGYQRGYQDAINAIQQQQQQYPQQQNYPPQQPQQGYPQNYPNAPMDIYPINPNNNGGYNQRPQRRPNYQGSQNDELLNSYLQCRGEMERIKYVLDDEVKEKNKMRPDW